MPTTRQTTASIFRAHGRPDQNGLYFIAETGVTPQIGRSQLPGKYVLGGYYWGLENTSFFGQPFDGKFGFYWQADQMLWREPSPEVVDGKGDDGIKAGVKKSKNVRLVGFGTFKVASRGPAPE